MTTRIANEIAIEGPIEPVFDLVTTTRYWTEWHPATVGVTGVVDRPVQLGDVIRERAQIGPRLYEGNWQVAEHRRPTRVLLEGETGRIRIGYTFAETGGGTLFRRELEYEPVDFQESVPDPERLETVMFTQSQLALAKLKRLIEGLLSTSPPASQAR